MRFVRFYLEYPSAANKRRKDFSTGCCIAVLTDVEANPSQVAVLCATFLAPNSSVSFNEINIRYLRSQCRKISEQKAREIHPALFERLAQTLK